MRRGVSSAPEGGGPLRELGRADQLHLVGNEVLHIPIGLGAAHTEHEIGEGLLTFLLIAGPGLITLVVGQKDGDIVVVDLLGGVDLHTVYHTVGTPVQDDALHIRQSGKLFGAVTSQEISDALKEQFGIVIEKNKIVQAEPIKAFGSYEVKAKLGYEVNGTINLLVVEAK